MKKIAATEVNCFCPDCGSKIRFQEASFLCPNCGFSIENIYKDDFREKDCERKMHSSETINDLFAK